MKHKEIDLVYVQKYTHVIRTQYTSGAPLEIYPIHSSWSYYTVYYKDGTKKQYRLYWKHTTEKDNLPRDVKRFLMNSQMTTWQQTENSKNLVNDYHELTTEYHITESYFKMRVGYIPF